MRQGLTPLQALSFLNATEDLIANKAVPCSRYGKDSRSCAAVAVEVARVIAGESDELIDTVRLGSVMDLVVNDHDEPEAILKRVAIDYRELSQEAILERHCLRCGSDAIKEGVCQFCGEQTAEGIKRELATLRHMSDELRDEVRDALQGESNDAEHDALVAVADHFGIEVGKREVEPKLGAGDRVYHATEMLGQGTVTELSQDPHAPYIVTWDDEDILGGAYPPECLDKIEVDEYVNRLDAIQLNELSARLIGEDKVAADDLRPIVRQYADNQEIEEALKI